MDEPIPFAKVCMGQEEEQEVLDCLRSGWITTGSRVARFEESFAEYVGCKNAVAVSSGTAGLHLSLWSLDLQAGDEVITPSLTWLSVPNLVASMGATPVFCDVDPETLCIDPDEIAQLITPNTKAIVPVHFAGRPANLNRICELAAQNDIIVIEDACHAIGATYQGKLIGNHSPLCVFSFHPNKNMTTAEGGMVCGLDQDRLDEIRLRRFHGITRDAFKRRSSGNLPHYDLVSLGLKYNLTDLAASLGIHQLNRLDEFNSQRRALVARYCEMLKVLKEQIWVPSDDDLDGDIHAWHLMTICVPDKPNLREHIMQSLLSKGIHTGLHYLPVHELSLMRDMGFYRSLPNTERIGRTVMSLPLFPGMQPEQQERVVDALYELLKDE